MAFDDLLRPVTDNDSLETVKSSTPHHVADTLLFYPESLNLKFGQSQLQSNHSESCGLAVEHSAHDRKVVGSIPVQSNARSKWCQSHARIDSYTQFWFKKNNGTHQKNLNKVNYSQTCGQRVNDHPRDPKFVAVVER